jgi:hypothetical protein|tara:strand:- start:1582 stop:3726 length:2145 start_codon:yes stop_codon:yes gene_type:complete
MQTSQSTLAKLLAKENIEIQHGNFTTAWFDVENRVLGLPMWKDRGKDVYDLLVGHEVGHALFTPADGWHESTTEIPGIPRSYVNVVEDVRIEKLVQRIYPGLVSSFKRGYKVLNDENFFGLDEDAILMGVDVRKLNLVDKINIKAKLRDLVDVSFSIDEQPIVDQVMRVETWDDVIEACKALYEFMKQKQQAQADQPSDQPDQPSSESEDQGDTQESNEDSPLSDEQSEDSQSSKDAAQGGGDSDKEEEQTPDTREEKEDTSYDDIEQVLTDEAFRENEHRLIDADERGDQPRMTNGLSRAQVNHIVVPYAKLKASRELNSDFNNVKGGDFGRDQMAKFEIEIKPIVATMAKEFEMRKAAFRLQRAQTARSGSINVNKLHSYKYNDDIFARITNLADAKSHGMIMFCDYSGSMCNVIGKVIRQTITLADFCKKVNIPFSVYGFTTTGRSHMHDVYPHHSGNICADRVGVFETISSSLSRSDYKEAREILIRQSFELDNYGRSSLQCKQYEDLGATPLYETILCAEYIIKEFKAKHNVQKINTVFLTDGMGDSFHIQSQVHPEGKGAPTANRYGAVKVKMNGKYVNCAGRHDMGEMLMGELRNIEGVTTIGFFMSTCGNDFKNQMWAMKMHQHTGDIAKARKLYNNQKFFSKKDTLGYDEYFVLNAKNWKTNTDELEVDTALIPTKAQITTAFKKYSASKKGNKVLATQFAKLVA